MRTLLTLLTCAMIGCDTYWASFIVQEPTGSDGGVSMCGAGTSCDLAVSLPGCSSNADCSGVTPFCDLNIGSCVAVLPPNEAFPITFETSIALNRNYMLMATGDYNGDGLTDVAVSGVLTGANVNATGATAVPVDIYLGDGNGGLHFDSSCVIPGDSPVFLLTAPSSAGARNDLLVATYGQKIYHCSRVGSLWTEAVVTVSGSLPTGFKKLALPLEEGRNTNDLTVQAGGHWLMDNTGANGAGSLTTYFSTGYLLFGGVAVVTSTSDITGVVPCRFPGDAGDSLATVWDAPIMHAGVEVHYIQQSGLDNVRGTGQTSSAAVSGTPYPELANAALANVTTLRVAGQTAPTLLFVYSQTKNSVTVLSGNTAASMAVQSQQTNLAAGGVMFPYAGDADGDGLDEIGLYTMAQNSNALTRHLQLLSYKGKVINTAAPLEDIMSATEDFRGMALGTLAGPTDRRVLSGRKDLIALLETPGSNTSRLIVRRANLNYRFP